MFEAAFGTIKDHIFQFIDSVCSGGSELAKYMCDILNDKAGLVSTLKVNFSMFMKSRGYREKIVRMLVAEARRKPGIGVDDVTLTLKSKGLWGRIVDEGIKYLIKAYGNWIESRYSIINRYPRCEADLDLLKESGWVTEEDEGKSEPIAETVDWDKVNARNICNVPYLKEIELYAVSDGIVSQMPAYGYKYAELYLSDLLPLADADARDAIITILRHNPRLNGPYYVINPRKAYIVKKHRWKWLKVVYDPKGKFYRVLHEQVELEKVFEKQGEIIVNAVVHLKDGSSRTIELLHIKLYLNDKHFIVPRSVKNLYKSAVRKFLESNPDLRPNFRRKILDRLSQLGNRESLLVYVYVNGKEIESPVKEAALRASLALGDSRKGQAYYAKLYNSTLLLPLESKLNSVNDERARELIEPFGNQRFAIVPREYAEDLFSKRKKTKDLTGLRFFKKMRSGEGEEGYEYELEWFKRPLNHAVVSDYPFTVLVLGFDRHNVYYVVPSRDGQEFEVINKHHGKERKFNLRLRLKYTEALEIVHLNPDLNESEKEAILAKSI